MAVDQGEVSRRLAEQYGDGIFQLGPLPNQINQVGLGAFQLGLRLSHRILAGYPGAVLVLGHGQRTLVGRNCGFKQALLLVHHPQLQIILHQFRLQAQANRRHVGQARLSTGLIGCQTIAQFAPQVSFPADAEGGAVGVTDTAAVVTQAGAGTAGALA
ncbi:hypothetical protein D3C77_506310 [compost metagenome]